MTRLEAAFSLIDNCRVFADIGCDHGKLCKSVLDANKAEKVIAVDISKASLDKARKLLYGYKNAEFRLCDGLDNGKIVADVVSICGLGGLTISRILRSLPQCTLVLGAQDHLCELRTFLSDNGYKFINDFVIKEGNRFYDFIKVVPGESVLDERQKEFGAFCYNLQPLLQSKLQYLSEKYSHYPKTSENAKKIKMITELMNWRQ